MHESAQKIPPKTATATLNALHKLIPHDKRTQTVIVDKTPPFNFYALQFLEFLHFIKIKAELADPEAAMDEQSNDYKKSPWLTSLYDSLHKVMQLPTFVDLFRRIFGDIVRGDNFYGTEFKCRKILATELRKLFNSTYNQLAKADDKQALKELRETINEHVLYELYNRGLICQFMDRSAPLTRAIHSCLQLFDMIYHPSFLSLKRLYLHLNFNSKNNSFKNILQLYGIRGLEWVAHQQCRLPQGAEAEKVKLEMEPCEDNEDYIIIYNKNNSLKEKPDLSPSSKSKKDNPIAESIAATPSQDETIDDNWCLLQRPSPRK